MKYFFAILLLAGNSLFAQTTKISDNKLYTLAKVWGLIKYYHPSVSQGKVNWDSTLLATLENRTAMTEDAVVTEWLRIADNAVPATVSPKQENCDSTSLRNFNIGWIGKLNLLSAKNKARLSALVNEPKNVGAFYSNPDRTTHKFSSANEKVYDGFSVDLKMLELFRAWNLIEYFYPYKYLLDKNWNDVLKKYIPVFKKIKTKEDYKLAIVQFAANIQDTHTGFEKTYQYDVLGKYTSPFTFQIVSDGALITKAKDEAKMQKAGIAVGDFITKINGKTVKQIIAEKSKYVAFSNEPVLRRDAFNFLFSSNDTVCKIEGTHADGKEFKTDFQKVQRTFLQEWDKDGLPDYHLVYKGKTYEHLVWNSAESRLNPGFRLDDKAYIEFSNLQKGDIDSLMTAYKNTKGIVFDLRSYNNEGYLMKVFDYLFSAPQFFGIKSQADFSQPGKFCLVDNLIDKSFKYIGKNNPDAYKGKVIVLINEYTQSAEETWAMVFKKFPGALFLGSQTAGADGNITSIKLTDGNEITFSGLGIYYPDGGETQRIGIRPDVIARPTIKSIRNKEDVLVEKAFELIDAN